MHGPPGVMYVWILETVYTLATCLGEALVDAFAILVSGRKVINLSFSKRKPIIFFVWVWHYNAISMFFQFEGFSFLCSQLTSIVSQRNLPDSWRKVDQSALDMSFTAPRVYFCSASVFFSKDSSSPEKQETLRHLLAGFSKSKGLFAKKKRWDMTELTLLHHFSSWKNGNASSPGLHHDPSWWLKANLPTHVWRYHPIGCLSFFWATPGGRSSSYHSSLQSLQGA